MSYIPFNKLIDAIQELDANEKKLLAEILHEIIDPSFFPKKLVDINELHENRFKDGLKCVYCESTSIRRFGLYKGRQRYQCKSCKRTFTDLTNTIVHKVKHLNKMGQYLDLLIEGYSIRKCAKILKISKDTAFTWRHKILHALSLVPKEKLQGIVEADETYELFSDKGSHKISRKPRKRGGVATKRGISKEQVCILVARDRNKTTISQVAGYGRISGEIIYQEIASQIITGSYLCSDEEPSFRVFCRKANLEQVTINSKDSNRVKSGIYHIQNVNAYHSRYKSWEARFKGIATKYINNYLQWFNFLESTMDLEKFKRLKKLFLNATAIPLKTTGQGIKRYYDSQLTASCG